MHELISDLKRAGFHFVPGGKDSHRKYRHQKFKGALVLSGGDNEDARHYQEKQVNNAIREAMK